MKTRPTDYAAQVRATIVLLSVWALGCGAKTALTVPPPCESDAACAPTEDACAARETRCDDGVDEDCDGDLDCLDRDCTCCVAGVETCDGTDEDCDGVADDGVTCFFADGVPITALRTTACGAEWYAYDSRDTASAAPVPDLRASGRVAVAIVDLSSGCGGAAVAVIADQVRDGSGGALEGRFSVDRPGIGGIFVGDEPRECAWEGDAGRCSWRWDPCCTDGVFVGPLGDDFCLTVVLDAPEGVSSIEVLDAELSPRSAAFGAPIELCGRTVPAAP